MKSILTIRNGLSEIEDCLTETPPESNVRGIEPGTPITTIWNSDQSERTLDPSVGTFDEDLDSDADERGDEGSQDEAPDFEPIIEIGAEVDEKFPSLDGDEGERIRQSILLHGIDALGWYASFHVVGSQWGIYVSTSGIATLMRDVFGPLGVSSDIKAHLAFHAILNHELFHFATDYAVAQSELTFREPWWLPTKSTQPGYILAEEKLANASMLRAFRTMKPPLRVRGKQALLREFTKRQPPGYREGHTVRRGDWDQELETLAHSYGRNARLASTHHALWTQTSGYDWAPLFPIRPRIDWRYCPIHIVHDAHRLGLPKEWLQFLSHLAKVEESPSFVSRLTKMDRSVQEAWDRTKQRLQQQITRGADFKKWPPGGADVYSVRVNNNVRAHLKGHPSAQIWTAIDIGGHKQMGHG